MHYPSAFRAQEVKPVIGSFAGAGVARPETAFSFTLYMSHLEPETCFLLSKEQSA